FQAEDGIRDGHVTGVQTCALPISTHSQLPPIIEAAKTIARHLPNVLTYFKHRITNAAAEGLNSKIATIHKRACGYRNPERFKIRSEERRVGKECRSRWSRDQDKRK